jgi:hypothetical protein
VLRATLPNGSQQDRIAMVFQESILPIRESAQRHLYSAGFGWEDE